MLSNRVQSFRGEICCVIDQDQLLSPDYLAGGWNTFQQEPSVTFIGGRVLPLPQQRLADWITTEHWSPLAISDYGTESFNVDPKRFVCLVAGAFRIAAMRTAGSYRGPLGIAERWGSVEDHEIFRRLVDQGKTRRYIPEVLGYRRGDEERFRRNYHRNWHFKHGKYFSDLHSPAFKSS